MPYNQQLLPAIDPRRQELAQYLMAQGLQPKITGTGVSGVVQGLGGLAQAWAGRRLHEKDEAEREERRNRVFSDLAATLGSGGTGEIDPKYLDLARAMEGYAPGTGLDLLVTQATKGPERKKPIQINDQLVDPDTFEVIRDYGDPDVPKTREVRRGNTLVTEEFDPATRTWKIVGEGSAFAPPAQTTVNVGGEQPAFEKEYGKLLAQEYSDIQKAGAGAAGQVANYQRLGALLSQVNTGKFKGTTNELKKAVKSLTPFQLEELGIADDTALVDAAKAISARLALEMRNPAGGAGMPGAMSDKDREFLQSMVASVETSPEAIPLMIEAAVKLQQRNQDVARLARDYRRENGGVMDDGFYDVLAEYSAANPLFSEADAERIGGMGAGETPEIPTFATPDDPGLAAMPSGSVFYDANGVLRTKP